MNDETDEAATELQEAVILFSMLTSEEQDAIIRLMKSLLSEE